MAIVGFVYFAWILIRENNAEKNSKEIFETCPLCRSKNVRLISDIGSGDTVECLDCGAEWVIKYSASGGIKSIKLISPSQDGTGQDLIGVDKPPKFWIELKKGTMMPHDKIKEGGTTFSISSDDIKEKLKKLQELYEGGLITEEEYRSGRERLIKEL